MKHFFSILFLIGFISLDLNSQIVTIFNGGNSNQTNIAITVTNCGANSNFLNIGGNENSINNASIIISNCTSVSIFSGGTSSNTDLSIIQSPCFSEKTLNYNGSSSSNGNASNTITNAVCLVAPSSGTIYGGGKSSISSFSIVNSSCNSFSLNSYSGGSTSIFTNASIFNNNSCVVTPPAPPSIVISIFTSSGETNNSSTPNNSNCFPLNTYSNTGGYNSGFTNASRTVNICAPILTIFNGGHSSVGNVLLINSNCNAQSTILYTGNTSQGFNNNSLNRGSCTLTSIFNGGNSNVTTLSIINSNCTALSTMLYYGANENSAFNYQIIRNNCAVTSIFNGGNSNISSTLVTNSNCIPLATFLYNGSNENSLFNHQIIRNNCAVTSIFNGGNSNISSTLVTNSNCMALATMIYHGAYENSMFSNHIIRNNCAVTSIFNGGNTSLSNFVLQNSPCISESTKLYIGGNMSASNNAIITNAICSLSPISGTIFGGGRSNPGTTNIINSNCSANGTMIYCGGLQSGILNSEIINNLSCYIAPPTPSIGVITIFTSTGTTSQTSTPFVSTCGSLSLMNYIGGNTSIITNYHIIRNNCTMSTIFNGGTSNFQNVTVLNSNCHPLSTFLNVGNNGSGFSNFSQIISNCAAYSIFYGGTSSFTSLVYTNSGCFSVPTFWYNGNNSNGFSNNLFVNQNCSLISPLISIFYGSTSNSGFTSIINSNCNAMNSYLFTGYFESGFGNGSIFNLPNCQPLIPLPISLLNFDVEKLSDRVRTFWTTKSEFNNDYFTVEKSINGFDWFEIGIVGGAGTYNGVLNYEYYDNNPVYGVQYYKLKQTDFDGNYTHSNIRSVFFTLNNYINAYPNPTRDKLTIVNRKGYKAAYIKVYDASGKLLSVDYVDETNEFEISLVAYSNGVYIVEIDSDDIKEQIKVIKN